MNRITPRISTVAAVGPSVLRVSWKGGSVDRIDLSGWIVTGGNILASLGNPDVFDTPRVADDGASVVWGDDDDLRIDSVNLERIAAGRPHKSA